jgi:hypothetical protein
MSFWIRYAVQLAWFTLLTSAVLFFAYKQGYFAFWQTRSDVPTGMRVEVYWRHPGMWSDWLLNFLLAWVVTKYQANWNTQPTVATMSVQIVVFVASLGLLWMWVAGSIKLYEPHAQGGLPSMTGCVHWFYFFQAMYVFAMFFIFAKDATPREVWVVTTWLTIHMFLGVVVPPAITFGLEPGTPWTCRTIFAALRDHGAWRDGFAFASAVVIAGAQLWWRTRT